MGDQVYTQHDAVKELVRRSRLREEIYAAVTPLWDLERGTRLALYRMSKNMTQKDLATRLGVTQQVIHSIETGDRPACVHFNLLQLERAVGAALEYILTGAGFEAYDADGIKLNFWTKQWSEKQSRRMTRNTK